MALKIRCPSCGVPLSMQDSLHGKNITCPKCNSCFAALTDEERQREKERLRLEAEKQKYAQEKIAQIQEQRPIKREEQEEAPQAYDPEHIPRTINCPDCGGIVSKQAATCPHCGKLLRHDAATPRKASQSIRMVLRLVIWMVVGLLCFPYLVEAPASMAIGLFVGLVVGLLFHLALETIKK
jgi:uncharacterized paraquat-inducible protein A